MGLVTGIWASYMIGIGGLLVVAGIALVYYSHTLEPISFVAKLVGISLTALLIFSGISGINSIETVLAPQDESVARQFQAAQAAIVSNEESANALPSLVSYIVSWPAPTDHQLASLDIHFLGKDVQPDDLTSIQGLGGDVDGLTVGGARRFAGVQFRDFYRSRFGHDGRVYEIGTPWLEYAHPVLVEVNKQILLTVMASLFVLILYPFFFRRHLFSPLNNLLQGVRRADKGQLETSLPVFYEDEIGFITHSFNQMMASLRRSNSRRDQFYAELKKANEELLAEIAERETAEAETRQRLLAEERLAAMASRLMRVTDVHQAATETLAEAGELVGASRVFLLRLTSEGTTVDHAHEWCAPGTEPILEGIADLPLGRDSWLLNKLRDEGGFYARDLSASAASASEEIATLFGDSAGPYFALPISAHDEMLGVLGCHGLAGVDAGFAQDFQALEVIAALLGSAIQRDRALETLEQRVAARTRELAAFFDLTMLAGGQQALPDILEPAVARIVALNYCRALCIHLLDKDGTTLNLVVQHNLPAGTRRQLRAIAVDDAFRLRLNQLGEPMVTTDLARLSVLPEQLCLQGFQSYLGVPLRAGGESLGWVSYYRAESRGFAVDESSLLAALAEQVAIMVENHRLRQRIEQVAVFEERQRLARDLHDSVTQSLYLLTLMAGAGQDAAEKGRTARVIELLGELETNALHALREMRLLLYELRPLALKEEGLARALELRLDTVERRAGVTVSYQSQEALALPPQVEADLYHLAIEALNNTLKHAAATALTVRLETQGAGLRMEITDNGCGFDTQQVSVGLGLQDMQERAERLGGQVEISSAPGEGTRIAVWIDLDAP
jgi:signal transduction histidine kinase/HAMP domain-containing protein